MLTLQKGFKYDGVLKNAIFTTLKLRFNYPVFHYSSSEDTGLGIEREVVGTHTLELIQDLSDGTYQLELPAKDIAGSDAANAACFVSYMHTAMTRPIINRDELAFDIDVLFSDLETATPVGGQTLGALCFLKNGGLAARTLPQAALEALVAPAPGIASPPGMPSVPVVGGAPATSLLLLSRSGYESLLAAFVATTGYQDESIFFALLRQLMDFVDERTHLLTHLNEAVFERLATMLGERGVANAKTALDALRKHFDKLFDFTLHMQEIRKLDVAGTFSLKTRNGQSAITRDDIALYDIYAEYSMLAASNGAGFRSVHLDWDGDQNPLENNGIRFVFTDKETDFDHRVGHPTPLGAIP